jgi:hypothetical protein
MAAEQSEHIVDGTVIETGWLCAQYMHGKEVPVWLHQTLAHVRQQTNKHDLRVVMLPACGREDSLVVMTLRDFLLWSHRRARLNGPVAGSSPCIYPSKEE